MQTQPLLPLLFLLFLFVVPSASIIVREYANTDCSGEDFKIVAVAKSNFCERDGTLTSMQITCRAGAIVMTKWSTTDCTINQETKAAGVEDSIKLMADTCTSFPMQSKAVFYDCSAGAIVAPTVAVFAAVACVFAALM